MGVVVLDEPVVGIAPAKIAPANYLDRFTPNVLNKTLFTAVGYGTEVRKAESGPQKPTPMSYPIIRRVARASRAEAHTPDPAGQRQRERPARHRRHLLRRLGRAVLPGWLPGHRDQLRLHLELPLHRRVPAHRHPGRPDLAVDVRGHAGEVALALEVRGRPIATAAGPAPPPPSPSEMTRPVSPRRPGVIGRVRVRRWWCDHGCSCFAGGHGAGFADRGGCYRGGEGNCEDETDRAAQRSCYFGGDVLGSQAGPAGAACRGRAGAAPTAQPPHRRTRSCRSWTRCGPCRSASRCGRARVRERSGAAARSSHTAEDWVMVTSLSTPRPAMMIAPVSSAGKSSPPTKPVSS